VKFIQVVEIPAGHPLHTQVEHGAVEGDKANEKGDPTGSGPAGIILASEYFREPVVHGSEKRKSDSSKYDKVKMSHHKGCIVYMHISGQCSKYQSGKSPDHKDKNKGSSPEEGNFRTDRSLVHGGDPVKNLDGTWYGNKEGKQGEGPEGSTAHARGKHVVSPYKITYKSNGQCGENNSLVTEDGLFSEGGNDL